MQIEGWNMAADSCTQTRNAELHVASPAIPDQLHSATAHRPLPQECDNASPKHVQGPKQSPGKGSIQWSNWHSGFNCLHDAKGQGEGIGVVWGSQGAESHMCINTTSHLATVG